MAEENKTPSPPPPKKEAKPIRPIEVAKNTQQPRSERVFTRDSKTEGKDDGSR